MHSVIKFLTLLLIGVNSQSVFEEIFDMNMGIPNLPREICLEGRSNSSDNNSGCSSNNESTETSLGTKIDLPVAPVENTQGCGYRNVNGAGSFITAADDSEAHFGEFPWVMAILKKTPLRDVIQERYICSGSLIHPKVVLTAAHHIWTGKSPEYKVRAGEWEPHRQLEEFPHQDREVSYRIIHPRFNRHTLWFDIALIFLEQAFDLTPNIRTICLAPSAQLVESSPCYVSGWGMKASNKKPPSVLKKIELAIRPKSQCERDIRAALPSHPNFALHSSFMCAGGELDKDACLGDGGAPLMCPITNTTNRYYQAGIVSWGLGCALPNVPGVYTNLRFLRSWIDEQMAVREITTSFYLAE